jgi:predicted RNA binding protein YcfA (HicA-like mRNA interferase family)
VSKAEKLFDKLIAGRSDANFSFDDLCTLLRKLGYTMRKTNGSHIIFQRGSSFLNLQIAVGGKAKAYQGRQELQKLQQRRYVRFCEGIPTNVFPTNM